MSFRSALVRFRLLCKHQNYKLVHDTAGIYREEFSLSFLPFDIEFGDFRVRESSQLFLLTKNQLTTLITSLTTKTVS